MAKSQLKTEQFLDMLLSDPRGQVIVCNILDGISENLYDEKFIKELFDWWQALYLKQKSRSLSAMLATLNTLVFENLPKGFRSGIKRPNFRIFCRRQIQHINTDESEFTTVVPVFILKVISSKEDLDRLLSQGIEFPLDERQQWKVDAINALMGLPEAHRKVRIDRGATIGRPPYVLWYTIKHDFEDILSTSGEHADKARDALGLVHHQSGKFLTALYFSGKALNHVSSGRPTFADAGTHFRFKTRADSEDNRKRSEWGHAADLEHFANGAPVIDGLPERISEPIGEKALAKASEIGFTPLGETKKSRGKTIEDDDARFALRLLNGRDTNKIKHEILGIIS